MQMKRLTSCLLAFALVLTMIPTALAADGTAYETQASDRIDSTTVWSYLDNNTDPAGDPASAGYDRTSWTAESFSADGWKTAAGPFGSKRGGSDLGSGYVAATVLDGCNGSGNTPAYFFRGTFDVASLEGKTKLVGTLQYDDGAIVYINGQRVAAFDDNACDASGASLNKGFDANLQYGGSNSGDPKTVSFEVLDLSILHTGTNTIAVELHNGRATSSDVWFHMTDLSLSDESVAWQTNLSLSVGADESQMNFTWYSPLTNAALTVADNAAMTGARTVTASADAANDGQYSCKAVVTGLSAGTAYYYQLENAGHKSEVYSFTTGGTGAFSFAYVGDPQIGASGDAGKDAEGWDRTLDLVKTGSLFSGVSFMLSAGDQVDAANSESQYDGYLDHAALTGLPVATVIGNHDSGSNAYGQHFNVANESGEYGVTAAGGDSWFMYNKVLFLVLNSNDKSPAGHKAFMEQVLKATANEDIRWKIVVFHHSIFTVASHSSDSYITDPTGFKNSMAPIFKELGIDVVLQGHDHVYCRTYMMDGLTPITESDKYEYANGTDSAPTAVTDPDGILYVTANSGSGSKTYNIVSTVFPFSAVQNQEHVPNVSKVTVSDDQFSIVTYRTTDMSVVDEFTIRHTPAAEPGYAVAFNTDGHASIDVYYKQDYTAPDETGVTGTVARSSKTGAVDVSGDGQVNFRVNVEEGYEIVSVTADQNYKNLKDSTDTGVENIYRLTKVTGPVTVTVTTRPTGSGKPEEPEYTPVAASDTRVKGYYNEDGALELELAGRYNSGAMSADGGSLEIVQYNAVNGFAYAVSGVKGTLIAVDLNGSLEGGSVVNLSGTEYDVRTLVSGFAYGDLTSVAISPDGTKLAAVIQAEGYADRGAAALFECNADGSLTLLGTVSVGVQPDMVTFADNSTFLTADEGEPRKGVNGTDPKGSVTVVSVGAGNALTADTVYFDRFDDQRDALTAAGVLIQKDTRPSADFEPEYIAVSGGTAYVALQEANAIAVLDIAGKTFTGVYPLGLQDYSVTKADLEKNNKIALKTYDNVYGIKMPDGISVAEIGGKTYLLTANEGDSRADWAGMDNEAEGKTSPTGNVKLDSKVVWFNANMWDGLDDSHAYVFGGRSFSIYEVTDTGLKQVYDSGSDFEKITSEKLADYFNCSNDKTALDNRSGKKGPEPESVITGVVDGRTYAFVGLERIGGVMVYDITDPANASFVNYINSREFEAAIQGDVSPEGLCFAYSKSGTPVLMTACEVSGTLAVYQMAAKKLGGETGGSVVAPAAAYAVTVAPTEHGSVTADRGTAPQGAVVNVTVTADKGWVLKSLTVTDAAGNTVPLTGTEGGYAFTMPGSNVTVKAVFAAEDSALSFADVPAGAYYYDAVLWAVENGVTTGTSAGTFSPEGVCTRGQIVTFLWRAAGSPAPKSGTNPFTDVKAGAYYYDAVLWAVENGVTAGTSADTFSPDGICTRAQAVTFLYRASGSHAVSGGAQFSDVTAGAYYEAAVVWAERNGITGGIGGGLFGTEQTCTRGQIVTFLYRAASV